MNYLITWFYGEKKGDESFYPSVGGNTSSPEFHKVYWKCVYDFYKSALLTNGQKIKYMFFTNINNIPTDVDGINILKFFSKNDIEVINIELSKKTPIDWYGAWRNQLYEFDILEYLSHFSDEDSFLILDSDCIIRRELYDVFEAVKKNRAVCYECGYTSNHSINGISILQMQSLYDEFYGRGGENVSYYGGEFIGLTSKAIGLLLNEFPELWEKNYHKYLNKDIKLNEEAHFLSMLYHKCGVDNTLGNSFIKRMWTSFKCDNVEQTDSNLPIWHLPAEKKYGFCELFTYFCDCPECTKEDYLRVSGKIMRIPYARIWRKAHKFGIKIKEKI